MTGPFDVRPVEPFELDSWDAYVESEPAGTLYHTSKWQRLINETYGDGRYEIVAAFGQNGIAGGFCALTRARLGVATAVTPLLTPYTGYLAASRLSGSQATPSEAGESASAILALADFATRYRYQALQCAPHMPQLATLTEAGYGLVPRRTLEINLRLPEDDMWSGFAGHVRRNIKKAQRAELEISDRWDDTQGLEIFRGTFERHGQKLEVPGPFFIETASGNILAEHRRRFCAWQGDTMMAFLVALHFRDTVYYHLAAANSEALKLGVSSLLIWKMLRDYAQDGYAVFDFVGGNTPGISKFKEGFGAEYVPHYLLEKCSSRRIMITRGLRKLMTGR